MVTACIDLGNTLRKAAVFTDGRLTGEYRFSANDLHDAAHFMQSFRPDRVIMASVTNHAADLESIFSGQTSFHLVGAGSVLNFSLAVEKPETVGPDRLALIAAAAEAFPKQNNLVIALGSCITYNFINNDHQFLGGGISPGLQMRFNALHEHTARLPLIKFEADGKQGDVPLIGNDTPTNIQSGVIHGMACEIDGMITAYRESFEGLNILLTGGHSSYFAGRLKNRIFADSNLLFKGLYALSEINFS